MRKNTIWTNEKRAELKALSQNFTPAEISKKMGMSETVIRATLTRLGLSYKPTNFSNKLKAKNFDSAFSKFYKLNTVAATGAAFGMGSGKVVQEAGRLGIRKRIFREWTDKDTKTLIKLAKTNGLTEICTIMGRCPAIVHRKLKDFNIQTITEKNRRINKKDGAEMLKKLKAELKKQKVKNVSEAARKLRISVSRAHGLIRSEKK